MTSAWCATLPPSHLPPSHTPTLRRLRPHFEARALSPKNTIVAQVVYAESAVRGPRRWGRRCLQSTAPAPTPSCPQTGRACAPFRPAWVRPLCARHVFLGKCVGGWVRRWGHVAAQKLRQQPPGLGCDAFAADVATHYIVSGGRKGLREPVPELISRMLVRSCAQRMVSPRRLGAHCCVSV